MERVTNEELMEIVRALLPELPELQRVERANLGSSDIIVVEVDRPMTAVMAERIREQVQKVWPNNRVVLIDSGMRLKVVREMDLTEEGYAMKDTTANTSAERCKDWSPSWFKGHWRDWHRGHGCNLDDGQPRSKAGAEEIARGPAPEDVDVDPDADPRRI